MAVSQPAGAFHFLVEVLYVELLRMQVCEQAEAVYKLQSVRGCVKEAGNFSV